MNTRRVTIVGLSVVAAAGLAAGGCAQASNSAQPSASGSGRASAGPSTGTSAVARSVLVASIQRLTQTTYRYHLVSGGLSGQGSANPVAKAATMSLTGTSGGNSLKIDMIAVNTDIWLKLNLGTTNHSLGLSTDKWLHIDAARLGAGNTLPVDPSGGAATASALLNGMVEVHQVDSRNYTGTIDLTKVTGVQGIDQDMLNQAGVKARSLPFTAALDDQGRLSDLKVDLSSVAAGQSIEVSYSDYGAPVTVTAPDRAQVTEAPDSVYQLFAPH